MTVYSWHDWQLPGVTPLFWAHVARDPADEAKRYLASPGAPIMLWRLQDRGLLDVSLTDFVRGTFNHERTAAWVATFMGLIALSGIRPPMLVLDYEEGFSNWHINNANGQDKAKSAEQFDAMLADAKLPDYARVSSAGLFTHPFNREAVVAWNRYATDQRNDALRKAVVTPARAAYGQPAQGGYELPITNYGDMRISVECFDRNGWPLRYDQSLAGWSSPSCYLPGRERLLSIVRSCRATSSRIASWISHPGYAEEGEWPALVRDVAKESRVLLWWNPRELLPEGDFERQRAIAAEVFGGDQ